MLIRWRQAIRSQKTLEHQVHAGVRGEDVGCGVTPSIGGDHQTVGQGGDVARPEHTFDDQIGLIQEIGAVEVDAGKKRRGSGNRDVGDA